MTIFIVSRLPFPVSRCNTILCRSHLQAFGEGLLLETQPPLDTAKWLIINFKLIQILGEVEQMLIKEGISLVEVQDGTLDAM